MSTRLTVLMVAALTGLGLAHARAEENRLLPFWGQPFPSGYVRAEMLRPTPILRCRVAGRHGRGRAEAGPCPTVLHARD